MERLQARNVASKRSYYSLMGWKAWKAWRGCRNVTRVVEVNMSLLGVE